MYLHSYSQTVNSTYHYYFLITIFKIIVINLLICVNKLVLKNYN